MNLADLSESHAEILRVASRVQGDDRDRLYAAATVFHQAIVALIAVKKVTEG